MTHPDNYELRVQRVARHLEQIEKPYSVVEGKVCDVRVFPGCLGEGTTSLISEGLSQFVFPATEGSESCSFELHLLIPEGASAEKHVAVVFEIAGLMVERFFDRGERPVLGEILPSHELKVIADDEGLSHLLLGWGAWLPRNLAWHEDQELGPLAICDLMPITDFERHLYVGDRAAFERKTASGEIDLLDFSRTGRDGSHE